MSHRVLEVVWSGLGWDRLGPLLDHQLLPTIQHLLDQGCRGQLVAPQPEVPIQIWQSILSGQTAARHGLYHPLICDAGSPSCRAATLFDARQAGLPVWIPRAGLNGIWVGWPHTAPESIASRRVVPRGFHCDPALRASGLPLVDCGLDRDSMGVDHLKPFFPELSDTEILADPARPVLQALLAEAGSLQAAATRLMQRGDWQLASVRFELGDRMGQLFGDCHPPVPEGVDPQRLIRYQHMLTGAVRLLDMMLARLVQLAGATATILVHSDLGSPRPRANASLDQPVHLRFRSSHSAQGFIVLSGHAARAGETLWGSSVLDVAPTMMACLGLASSTADGRVLREGLRPDRLPSVVEFPAATESPPVMSASVQRALLQTQIDSGVIDEESVSNGADTAAEIALFHGLSLLQGGEASAALPIFEALTREAPQQRRSILHRARCHLALGDFDQARAWTERFLALGDPDLRSHMLLGRIALLQDRTDEALIHFFQAEQLQPDDPVSHCQIGDAYRRAGKTERAVDAFERALALDPDQVEAHLGLAKVHLTTGADEAASVACLAALESNYRHADVHFHLGVALARMQRVREAMQAFEICLQLAPARFQAHEWLAQLYRSVDGGVEKAAAHQAQAMTARQQGQR